MDSSEIENWIITGEILKESNLNTSNTSNLHTLLTPKSQSMMEKSVSTNSIKSDSGFSKMSTKEVYAYFGFKGMNEVKRAQVFDIKKTINFTIQPAPPLLKNNVYNRLKDELMVNLYPSSENHESIASAYVKSVLNEVIRHLILECRCQLKIIPDYIVKLSKEEYEKYNSIYKLNKSIVPNGKPDFTIVNKDFNVLLVVEVKRGTIEECYKQAFLYLNSLFMPNKGDNFVYCLCSNGEDWCLISFDGNKFNISKRFLFLFPEIENPDNFQTWETNCSLLVDIVYSIIKSNYIQ